MPSRYLSAGAVFAGALIFFASGSLLAQQPRLDLGEREYVSNCAVCHGLTGKGDGVYKEFLNKSPSDLTSLSKANKGVFPYQKVYEIIDGRQQLKAHGPGDMPIWGAEYSAKAATDYLLGVPYDREAFVRTRIIALIEYLYRLQAT
jgi:mono/diheme cytochrome c family protein